MPRPERGATPAGFRAQLLAHLRNRAQTQAVAVQRLQQRVAFERFPARLDPLGGWTLKGGFALELRYGWAYRPTRDIDLHAEVGVRGALDRIRSGVAESAIADHFAHEFGTAVQILQGAPTGTLRVSVLARLAGEEFGRFHSDLSSGDALAVPPDSLEGSELLRFAGIPPIHFPVYPVTQHLAEKLHAYTLPRDDDNTRVKGLIDLVALAGRERVSGTPLVRCLQATFEACRTHELPAHLPAPPNSWAGPFAALARVSSTIPTTDLQAGHVVATHFWDPVCAGR